MKAAVALFAALLVAGCATYTPIALRVNDAAQFAADVAFCTDPVTLAKGKPSFNVGDVGYGLVSGAGQSAPGAVVGGPLVAGVGALGGGTSALATGLDAFGKAVPNLSRHCIYDTTMQDHSAIMARPED